MAPGPLTKPNFEMNLNLGIRMPIGTIFSQGSSAAKPPVPSQPGKPVALTGKTGAHTRGAGEPGGEPPHQLHDSQPDDKPKMSLMDKVSAGANVAGAAASFLPMLGGGSHGAKPPQPPKGGDIDDIGEYNKLKLLTAVGPPPINW